MGNMEYWDKVKRPPVDALKKIGGGRLKGMTDINPQWRYQVMTEVFGPCGLGWYAEICDRWIEEIGNEVCSYVKINLYIFDKENNEWSKQI